LPPVDEFTNKDDWKLEMTGCLRKCAPLNNDRAEKSLTLVCVTLHVSKLV